MNLIEDGGKGSPQELLATILLRRKWQIAITFLLVVAGVTSGTLLMPKQYETHLKILVKNDRADTVVTADRNSGLGYRGEVSETQINTEIELLNSENLLQQVAVKCRLERLEHLSEKSESERLPVAIEKAVSRLQRNLKISSVRKADIIQVDYSASDPHQAAAVLRQLAESYLDVHLKIHSTPGTYEFFTSQAGRYHKELKEAEMKIASFGRQNDIVLLVRQEEEMLQKAGDAEAALLLTEATIEEYRYKTADTRKQLDTASPRVVTQSRTVPNQYSVDHLGSMIAELKNRRTQLLGKFLPDDRVVQENDLQISETQAALEKAMNLTGLEQSTDVNPVHQTLEVEIAKEQSALAGAEARRNILAQQVQSYRRQLMKLGNATAPYDDLARNQKEAAENYLLYAKKAEEARIAESLDQQKIANVAIVGTPTEPHLPSKPNVPLNLGLGVVLAGFLSLGMAFGTEYFRGPLRLHGNSRTGMSISIGRQYLLAAVENPTDLEELTGLAVLATSDRP